MKLKRVYDKTEYCWSCVFRENKKHFFALFWITAAITAAIVWAFIGRY